MRPEVQALTKHAVQRMQQRNLRREEVMIVCTYGAYIYRAGAVSFFLGRRQLNRLGKEFAKVFAHLEGVTVLCCSRCMCVLTVYHNLHGLKEHRRKQKYNWKGCTCPISADRLSLARAGQCSVA